MTGTMTSAGLDVHARSIDAAAICVATGEVTRRRFGGASDPVIGWLIGLPGPVHACYEAGPTGFGLFRAANAAGIRMDVVAPSKTPRAAGERVKTDRKDAELLARLLLAGQLNEPTPSWRRPRFEDSVLGRGDASAAMARPKKYPDELVQRGVRLALEGEPPIAHIAHDLLRVPFRTQHPLGVVVNRPSVWSDR